VRVSCDYVFEAYCPTITRDIEIATHFETLVQQLWHDPGWASRDQLKPSPGVG